jgi:hypothetical protein
VISRRIVCSVGFAVLGLASVAGCSEPSHVWVAGHPVPSASASPVAAPPPDSAPVAAAPPPVSSPAASASPSAVVPSAVVAGPERFVAAVRREMPELALDRRDEEIADLGGQACSSIRSGRGEALTEYGVTAAQARQLRRVARADLCPR